jgi:hypothetical protein
VGGRGSWVAEGAASTPARAPLAWGGWWWAGSQVAARPDWGPCPRHPAQPEVPARHTHLPVCHLLPALAGRAGPALVAGPGPAVVWPLLGVALLVGGRGVVMVVVMVWPMLPVLGPAPFLVPLFRW